MPTFAAAALLLCICCCCCCCICCCCCVCICCCICICCCCCICCCLLLAENSGLCVISADAAFAAAALPSLFSCCSCCSSLACFFFEINRVDKRKFKCACYLRAANKGSKEGSNKQESRKGLTACNFWLEKSAEGWRPVFWGFACLERAASLRCPRQIWSSACRARGLASCGWATSLRVLGLRATRYCVMASALRPPSYFADLIEPAS